MKLLKKILKIAAGIRQRVLCDGSPFRYSRQH